MAESQTVPVRPQQLDQQGRPVVEPGAFFCDGNVSLRINTWNALAGVTVTVRLRFLRSTGEEVDNSFDVIPNTNRTKGTNDFPLAIGFPLNIVAFASVGTPPSGRCFVQVQLIRGSGGAATKMATLLQDYVTSSQDLAWPGSPIRSSLDAAGALLTIQGTTPGAGAEVSETVPTNARWALVTFFFQFLSSAVVANRRPYLNIDDGANVYFRQTVNQVVTANQSWRMSFAGAHPALQDVNFPLLTAPIPTALVLPAGFRIRTQTLAIDPGDQYSSVLYLVRENIDI